MARENSPNPHKLHFTYHEQPRPLLAGYFIEPNHVCPFKGARGKEHAVGREERDLCSTFSPTPLGHGNFVSFTPLCVICDLANLCYSAYNGQNQLYERAHL